MPFRGVRFSETLPGGVAAALYARTCAGPIRARIDRGELQAGVIPEGVRADVVGPDELTACDPDGLLFVNVNTPHDHARARTLAEEACNWSEDRIMDDSDER